MEGGDVGVRAGESGIANYGATRGKLRTLRERDPLCLMQFWSRLAEICPYR